MFKFITKLDGKAFPRTANYKQVGLNWQYTTTVYYIYLVRRKPWGEWGGSENVEPQNR